MVDIQEIQTHAIHHCPCDKCKQFRNERELILAERERCARIAEEFSSHPNDPSWQYCEPGAEEGITALAIAAKIREG